MKAILAGVLFTAAVILQLTSARSRQSGLSFALLMASLIIGTYWRPIVPPRRRSSECWSAWP